MTDRVAESSGSFRDLLRAHPDALWRMDEDDGSVQTTNEVLAWLPERVLREAAVRIGDRFYRPSSQTFSESVPLLTLLHPWSSDTSLSDALQTFGEGLWLDLAGVWWTADQLLEKLTLEQLSTPVDLQWMDIDDEVRFCLTAHERCLLGHMDLADTVRVAIALKLSMSGTGVEMSSRAARLGDEPFWPLDVRSRAGSIPERASPESWAG
jgi:hypothetical protein